MSTLVTDSLGQTEAGRKLAQFRFGLFTIAKAHGASNLRVFGSVARGEASEDSDIDLLVDLAPGSTLLDLAALKRELSDLIGRPVDVATSRSLRPRVREQVLREAIAL